MAHMKAQYVQDIEEAYFDKNTNMEPQSSFQKGSGLCRPTFGGP